MKIIKAVAKPFSHYPRGLHQFSIDADGTVRVWDGIAGHYTTCHSMTAQTQRRIIRLSQQS